MSAASAVARPLGAAGHPRKWLILAVVTMVAFTSNVDATIVVIGLPRIVSGLHSTVLTGLWILNAYIIASTVFLLPAGRWSDVVGRKSIFIAGSLLFSVGTVGCGLAPTGAALVLFRVVQGVGAALGFATATPLLVSAFPSGQLGRALGINSTAWVSGMIVGPVVGGALVGSFGWRWIFYVTVPFALAGVVAGAFVLPGGRPAGRRGATDWLGAISFSLGLVALLLALTQGLAWGWSSLRIVSLALAAVVLLGFFVVWERLVADPLFDLSLFRHPYFRVGMVVVTTYSIGIMAMTFLLTFYLQGALRLSPLVSGLALVPMAAPQFILAPIGGSLADRFGPARPIVAGLACLSGGAIWLSRLGPHLAWLDLVLPLLLISVGNGLAWPSLLKQVMSSAPSDRAGTASGMFFTLRNVGVALSFTLALIAAATSLPPAVAVREFLGTGGVLASRLTLPLVHSTDAGFRVFGGCLVVALLLSLLLLRRIPSPAPASRPRSPRQATR
ncbi:MAG TPA: MFS transporter [Candidatus Dormibacteraeota bacterium]|nr:MFS transporter [Candidatus Dormibacteraeota bacterium]